MFGFKSSFHRSYHHQYRYHQHCYHSLIIYLNLNKRLMDTKFGRKQSWANGFYSILPSSLLQPCRAFSFATPPPQTSLLSSTHLHPRTQVLLRFFSILRVHLSVIYRFFRVESTSEYCFKHYYFSSICCLPSLVFIT